MHRKAFLIAAALASAAFAPVAFAQTCPQPNPWNGDEPFTHCTQPDEAGICRSVAALENGVYPNGTYPTCKCPDGSDQIGHNHWEYTHLHTDEDEVGGTVTEEKDYLDTESPDMAGQTQRFLANEPKRFDRALNPSVGGAGAYWQVDEWIGPAAGGERVPGLTWTERFFECSGLEPCATVGGAPALGGYWSTNAQDLYDAFSQPVECGEPLTAAGPRSGCCGMLFPQFP